LIRPPLINSIQFISYTEDVQEFIEAAPAARFCLKCKHVLETCTQTAQPLSINSLTHLTVRRFPHSVDNFLMGRWFQNGHSVYKGPWKISDPSLGREPHSPCPEFWMWDPPRTPPQELLPTSTWYSLLPLLVTYIYYLLSPSHRPLLFQRAKFRDTRQRIGAS
jgi:hypothetical protein